MHYFLFMLLATKTFYSQTSIGDYKILIRTKVDWTVDTIKYNDGTKDVVKSRITVKRKGNKVETKFTQTYDKCGNLIRQRKTVIYHGCFSNEKVNRDKNFKGGCQ
jgi:hypothetical protein